MRHGVKGRKLGRTASHRRATLANLSCSLIRHKRIHTTLAKAKALRVVIEPLVTKAKRALAFVDVTPEKGVHLRRVAKAFLKEQEIITILFGEIAEKVATRNGGYTRILKTGHRPGDGGETAIIEFVDFDVVTQKRAHQDAKEEKKGGKDSAKGEAPAKEVKEEKKTKKVAAPKNEKPAKTKKVAAPKTPGKQKV